MEVETACVGTLTQHLGHSNFQSGLPQDGGGHSAGQGWCSGASLPGEGLRRAWRGRTAVVDSCLFCASQLVGVDRGLGGGSSADPALYQSSFPYPS